MTTLGQHIRTARQTCRLTLKQVGSATGLSAPYLSDIERGNRIPPLSTIERIADTVALDPTDLTWMWTQEKLRQTEAGRIVLARLNDHS